MHQIFTMLKISINLKNTNLVADELISLPFHARLSNNDIKKVCDKIRLFLNE